MTAQEQIKNVLAGHWSASTHSDQEPFVDKCDGCGAVILTWGETNNTLDGAPALAAHQAVMLAIVVREAVAHERHHTIQEIRDAGEHESAQVGDYGRVELEGYLTITDGELGTIENNAGADRMCMTVEQWEAGLTEAQAAALEDAAEYLSQPYTVWRGDSGVTVDIGDAYLRRPKLTDWLRDRAAQIREGQ